MTDSLNVSDVRVVRGIIKTSEIGRKKSFVSGLTAMVALSTMVVKDGGGL